MSTDKSDSDHESGDQDRSDACQENDDDAGDDEHAEGLPIGESAAEQDKGLISGAEEVKEEPGGEEGEEDDEGDGVGEKREGHNKDDSGEIVYLEVGVVFPDAKNGVGEGFRL